MGLGEKLPQVISVLSIAAQPAVVHPRAAAPAAVHVQTLCRLGPCPIFMHTIPCIYHAPALGHCGVPVPPPDRAPSEEQVWVPNCVYIGEGAALGEVSLHHTSPPRQTAPDLFKVIVSCRLCSVALSKGSGSSCAKLT